MQLVRHITVVRSIPPVPPGIGQLIDYLDAITGPF